MSATLPPEIARAPECGSNPQRGDSRVVSRCAGGSVSVALCARARVLLDAAAIDPAISIRLRRMLSEPLVAPERPPADELRACLRALLVLDTLSPAVAEGVVALLDGGAL